MAGDRGIKVGSRQPEDILSREDEVPDWLDTSF